MLTAEKNERIARVGPQTPMGQVLRRYWQPALLASEVPEPDSAPVRVRLLGEDLVAFRDSTGKVGLIDSKCPHRRAPMFFGRNEEAGLRCVYHGWKFDTAGNCVDLPSEPPGSPLQEKVHIDAYPTWEAAGIVWAYLGPRSELPDHPDYEWLRAPATHVRVSRTDEHCNWVQALEGGLDTSHVSFAHNNDLSDTTNFWQRDTHPRLEVELTPYGFRYAGLRDVGQDLDWVRAYQYIMPAQQLRPGTLNVDGTAREVPLVLGHVWVPRDDDTVAVYNLAYSVDLDAPITDALWAADEARAGRAPQDYRPGTYWLQRDPDNDYLIDRDVQRTRTFTGIEGVNTQDFALQEGMDPICDRSREHLGTSDRAIIALRRLLLEATDVTEQRRGQLRGLDPETYRWVRSGTKIVPNDLPWQETLKDEMAAVWG